MRNYSSREVSEKTYQSAIKTQNGNRTPFMEHQHGSRKKLIVKNILCATTSPDYNLDIGGLTRQKFISFLGLFSRRLYAQFRKNESLYSLDISQPKNVSKNKNDAIYNSLQPGDVFYNIDIKSAYWQIAHRIGYIDDVLYEDYMPMDDYKEAKRYAITFLGRENKMTYRHLKNKYVIECDTGVLRKAYDNIRNELYRLIRVVVKVVPDYIEFNIDGITVIERDYKKARDEFAKLGLQFKITRCVKIDNFQYYYGCKIKNFRLLINPAIKNIAN